MKKQIQYILIAITLIFSFGLKEELQANTTPTNNGNLSIANFLNTDGTLDIPHGFTGNLDISGFSLEIDECEGIVATPAPMTSGWSAVGSGLPNSCYALAVGPNGNLYVGGFFNNVNGVSGTRNIAKWDGSNWSPLGSGFSGDCRALAFSPDGSLYVGGFGAVVGVQGTNGIAKWDGNNWSPVGYGMLSGAGRCYSILAAPDGSIYIGGKFSNVQNSDFSIINAKNIAKWDGSNWSALSGGLSDQCWSLALDANGILYAAGQFSFAYNDSGFFISGTKGIAKWDGSSWSAVGSGFNNSCFALAIAPDGTLYAGGAFTWASGAAATRVARWDGNSWSAVGSGLSAVCYTLAVGANGTLYAGGFFTQAGGNPALRVAKWEGNNWSPLGSGFNAACQVLAYAPDGMLYAGGDFTQADGLSINRIAKWETSTPCNIEINSVNVIDATCTAPGSITINAGCTSCSGILYSIDGGVTTQASNTFTGLAAGTYMPYIEDSGNDGCNDMSANETISTTADNTPPTVVCKTNTVVIQPDGTYSLVEADVYDDIASSDNCSIDDVSFPASTYGCIDDGQSFSIPVTITDSGGNTANCNATITIEVGNALPGGWSASDVGNSGSMGNNISFDPCSTNNTGNAGEFVITGGGNNATSTTSDNVAFASQTICGDGTITTKIENVGPNGYGGLMIRETTEAGAKQVAIFSNMTPMLRHEARYTTNGFKQVSNFFKPSPLWLRLERSGGWIFAYYSITGSTFQYVHAVPVSMQSCVEFGLASFTYLPTGQTAATFSNVAVTGAALPNASLPNTPVLADIQRLKTPALYPNPASSEVNLVFESPIEIRTMAVLRNQLGQAIEQRQLEPGDEFSSWNVSLLENGLYFLEISTQGQAK